jgi:hypothetical protein
MTGPYRCVGWFGKAPTASARRGPPNVRPEPYGTSILGASREGI